MSYDEHPDDGQFYRPHPYVKGDEVDIYTTPVDDTNLVIIFSAHGRDGVPNMVVARRVVPESAIEAALLEVEEEIRKEQRDAPASN